MDETGIKLLNASGIDYNAGVKRFMGKAAIYEKVLLNFLSDSTLERAQASFAAGDIPQLADDVHEIKGASGNMDMSRLYAVSSAMVSMLRGGSFTESELAASFDSVKAAYSAVKDGIRQSLSR